MPCGWVLLWHMLSRCLKAGRCHGLNSPYALRLGVLKEEDFSIRVPSWYYARLWTKRWNDLLETTASSTSSVQERCPAYIWPQSWWSQRLVR